MRNVIKWSLILSSFLVLGYFAIGYISSYLGWYGYNKWQYRVATSDINDSKKEESLSKNYIFKLIVPQAKWKGLERI